MKKVFSVIAAASFLVMSSCADKAIVKPQHEQVNISFSWWGNDKRHEYTISGIEVFEKLHPDIKVDISYSEWSGYEARSRVRMISDTESDVMQINIGWVKQFSPDGRGYYDRYLQNHSLISFGLCYNRLIIDYVVNDAYDKRVDFVVSEKRIITCNGGQNG